MLRCTAPLPSRLQQQQQQLLLLLPVDAAVSTGQQQRCPASLEQRAAGTAKSIFVVDRRRPPRRQGHLISPSSPTALVSSPPLITAPPRRPAVTASASRRAAAAVVAKTPPSSLLDPKAVSEALKAFFASPPPSLAAALAAAATLPPARRDALATLATAIGAYALVKFFEKVATKVWLDQKLTRKLVHTLAGPLFVASWPLFSASDSARCFAAAVPLANGLRLVLAGTGVTSSEGSVRSMTRLGDRTELLRGPLYYVLALVAATLVFWRLSPASACAVAAMCGGDGLADIAGRRAPPDAPRIPWNREKTFRGSAAMFSASLAFAVALVWLFAGFGYFTIGEAAAGFVAAAAASSSSSPSAAASAAAAAASSSSSAFSVLFASFSAPRAAASALAPPTVAALAAVALAATAVESLPANALVQDNVSVPLVAMALAWWLFERSC